MTSNYELLVIVKAFHKNVVERKSPFNTSRGLGVVVRVLIFNLWDFRFESRSGCFMLESW